MSSPGIIRKLEKFVVDKIAAGEVIQRPANAIKELIENSIDAHSTSIQITVHSGGLKFIQIQDNGTGIRKNDLEIVCERFTTSKLSDYNDLKSVSTYGFRGEALTSISHVSHLTIKTRVAEEDCGYKASYVDGKLVGKPTPCAMNQGTQITIEDLFYNVSTRSKTLKNDSDEFARIMEVVSNYAIHNAHIAFMLKKQGENIPVIRTPANCNPVDNIRTIYGNSIGKEIIEIEENNQILKFEMKGYITKPSYTANKLTLLLFVNNRLVESTGIRKGIEQAYSYFLQKDDHPFLYIKLNVNPRTIDVNVHPTKHEVIILHEQAIVNKIKTCIHNALFAEAGENFCYTQALLPGASEPSHSSPSSAEKPKQAPQHMVRTDSTMQTLDKYVVNVSQVPGTSTTTTTTTTSSSSSSSSSSTAAVAASLQKTKPPSEPERREIRLTSILELRDQIKSKLHIGLRDIIKNSTFVGCVCPKRVVIQHETKLYLCNTAQLSFELFYQLMVYNFGNFGLLKFEKPIMLKELALIALDSEEFGWKETDGTKEDIAQGAVNLLKKHAMMLEDYFSMKIDSNGYLQSIPLLLDGYCPDIGGLPIYIMNLMCNVDWKSEKKCFQTFCTETARFYREQFMHDLAVVELIHKLKSTETPEPENNLRSHWSWIVEHIIYPAMKQFLLPPKEFAEDATVLEIANLPEIYKVFERC